MKTNKIPFSPQTDQIEQEAHRVLDSIAERTTKKSKKTLPIYPYTLVGKIDEVYNNGSAKVSFVIESQKYTYHAITIHPLKESDENRECMLNFNQGDITKPIITGIIQTQESEPVVISSDEGVVLECGDTRIVLDADGTLDLRALHINSQAYGPYRIKGGSVKIN